MPRIFDNIDLKLLPALCQALEVANRSDFCVGYFNLRGWRALDSYIEGWSGGEGRCCRLLVGMQRVPDEELRVALRVAKAEDEMDNQTALRLKKSLAAQFRNQLMVGFPTNEDEAGLRRLAAQIKAKKVVVTESQYRILLTAECNATTPALPRHDKHHQMVDKAVAQVIEDERSTGGQLGRPSGARFKTYERLKRFLEDMQNMPLLDTAELAKAVQEIYRYPLRQSAIDILNRQLRSGIADEELAELVQSLRQDNALCVIHEEEQSQEPQIICSMGLRHEGSPEIPQESRLRKQECLTR